MSDEFAPFSAARNSGIPATSAMVKPRTFACGCAALSETIAAGIRPALGQATSEPQEDENKTIFFRFLFLSFG